MYTDEVLCFRTRLLLIFLVSFLLLVANHYSYRKNVNLDNELIHSKGVDDFIPPFINIISDLYVAPNYGLAACGIRKSMAQLTINIMCLLYDSQSFEENNQSLNDTWILHKPCQSSTKRKFKSSPSKLKNYANMTKFAFIRDPFDRFISFYLDKCVNENICYRKMKCGDDMHCIVRNLYKSLKQFKLNRYHTPSYADLHAAPLSWNCGFDNDMENFILLKKGVEKEERTTSVMQLANILKKQNVPKDLINTIVDGSLNGETLHSTHNSERRIQAEHLVRTDPVIRDYLHKIYFYDYIIFNFDRSVLDIEYQHKYQV